MDVISGFEKPKKPRLKSTESGVQNSYTLKNEADVIAYINNRKRSGASLREIARKDFDGRVNHGVIQRVLKGSLPKRPAIREALGLAPRLPFLCAAPLPPGVLIPWNAKALRCANPDCGVWFVRTHPRQIYHDKKCRK